MIIDIFVAVAVAAWLLSPVVLALVLDRPTVRDRRRRCCGVRFFNR